MLSWYLLGTFEGIEIGYGREDGGRRGWGGKEKRGKRGRWGKRKLVSLILAKDFKTRVASSFSKRHT